MLDKWQTTSEAPCGKESLPNGTVDRFVFTIKLADVLSRAEEKTRYTLSDVRLPPVRSGTITGRNYHVQIVGEKVPKANKETVVEKPQESSLADLRR